MPHAVSRLRSARMALDTRPKLDRGDARKPRCPGCRLGPGYCMCALRPRLQTRVGVCLIMAEFEALKPSNTGWLIADVLPDTAAFGWARSTVDPALLAMLGDPQWQPFVVFPGEFAEPERVVNTLPACATDTAARRPLLVMLDGTWAEARKMFRKSPYLSTLPVLSLQPEQLSRYRLRRHIRDNHFCTAEVAALCLELAGETHAAQTLDAYLDVFTHRYLQAKQTLPVDEGNAAHRTLRELSRC
ncbi:DTW domain-containing protein YfiP [Paucibacter oligotrophus]|uniref:tRNA-uridine aminocarboxypropyltransferase n=1 Tax=Roseateles oligotrophus TaxID=1769250 RepID=A0A840L9Y7_9BURK|nr:tRNA-uridine aminocarboxypropyltransferase [Roseateles oligotrophus]MBB4842939.1 DTW domain-containing protein YfiP [Roseateles oligotrophus]